MRTSALVLSLALAACSSTKADWAPTETTGGSDQPSAHAYAARPAKEVEILDKAPAAAERLSDAVEGREQPGRSALDDLRARAGELGADCVVVTNRASFATDVVVGAKQWEVVRGTAYRRSR